MCDFDAVQTLNLADVRLDAAALGQALRHLRQLRELNVSWTGLPIGKKRRRHDWVQAQTTASNARPTGLSTDHSEQR